MYFKRFSKSSFCESLSFILIGDSAVGKSNFLSRYMRNTFNLIFLSSMSAVTKEKKIILINDQNFYELTIWDTAGQERFKSIPRTYYRNVDGVLLLFDINDKSGFENVKNWINDVNENIDTTEGEEKDVVIYLLGNKVDLTINDDNNKEEGKEEEEKKEKERVAKEEIEKLVNELKIKYYDISCKWNLNIDEVVARIILDCIKKKKGIRKTFVITQQKSKTKNEKKGGCCDK